VYLGSGPEQLNPQGRSDDLGAILDLIDRADEVSIKKTNNQTNNWIVINLYRVDHKVGYLRANKKTFLIIAEI
jgi:hypothetical protein